VAVFWRASIEHWPVALVVAAGMAVPIGFQVASPAFTLSSPPAGYPIRIELPRAEPAVEFDLSTDSAAGAGGSAIELRKAVHLNGAEAGSAAIRVSAGSTLAIAVDELRALLEGADQGDLAGRIARPDAAERFVEFEELRRQGIDVRYDAAADRVVVVS